MQTKYLEELVERVLRGKMRALDLKQMLLDNITDVVLSFTSFRSMTGLSDRPHILSSPSYPKGSSAYGATGASDTRLRWSQSGSSVDEAISLSSDDSCEKERTTKHVKCQCLRSGQKYLFTMDMDKDLLIALRVNIFFSIIFFMVLIY